MREELEKKHRRLIKDSEKGLLAATLRLLLTPASWIYRFGVFVRNGCYDLQLLNCQASETAVVISIGNIAVGGTGKTPVTLKLAKELAEIYPTAILTRGYRSPAETMTTPLVQSKGFGPEHPASLCGDEPYLLSRQAPKATVIVGADRCESAVIAKDLGAEVIILDDGMQHRRLGRDFEVVVLNGYDPLGRNKLLPRGELRDSPRSLKRADLIIANNIENAEQLAEVKKMVAPYTLAPIIAAELKIKEFIDIESSVALPSLKGKKAGVFCAIANPQNFDRSLSKLGIQIVSRLYGADHGHFTRESLENFAVLAKEAGADCLVCTEKDAVKLTGDLQLAIPLLWARAEIEFSEGEEHWHALIRKQSKRTEEIRQKREQGRFSSLSPAQEGSVL